MMDGVRAIQFNLTLHGQPLLTISYGFGKKHEAPQINGWALT